MTIEKKYRPRCFFDIETGGQSAGRIVFELFADTCPITCENFRALCTGEKGLGKTTGKALHYKDTIFHRVVRNFMVQGGDFSAGNGSGGESIYGGTFADENFLLKHDNSFYLSMANRGKDTNGSQFFITTQPTPHLDGVHVVFGRVISGHEIVSEVESQRTDQSSRPLTDVKISNCGELVLKSKSKEKTKRTDQDGSPLEEGEMSDDKGKRKKKHKKHQKKNRKDRPRHKDDAENAGGEDSRDKRGDDPDCSVRADEIPDIPTNNFLMRRGPPGSEETRRPTYRHEGYVRRTKISKSGRKIKGRGHMRYRTPSPEGSRSGSETPPHWKQAQSRVRSLKEVLEEKKRLLEELEAQEEIQEAPEEEPQVQITEGFQDRFTRGHRDEQREEYNIPKRNEQEITSHSRGRDARNSIRRHSEHSSGGDRGRNRERDRNRGELEEGPAPAPQQDSHRNRRSHRQRKDSEDEEFDSSTSPVRRGMQSTIISKVVFQNMATESVPASTTRIVRRFTEEKLTKVIPHKPEVKKSRSSSDNRRISDSKHGTTDSDRNGVGRHRHHHRHHRHHHEKEIPKEVMAPVDSHSELGLSPMANLEVDKDTNIVDMDCTPILHHVHEDESSLVVPAEKVLPIQELVPDSLDICADEPEVSKELEFKTSVPVKKHSPRIRIPGLGSDDDTEETEDEEPPPPPGTEEIVLFKNYPPAMPPMPYTAEASGFTRDFESFHNMPAPIVDNFIPAVPPPPSEVTAPLPVEEFPITSLQKLPFLDDDSEDEAIPAVPLPPPKQETPPPQESRVVQPAVEPPVKSSQDKFISLERHSSNPSKEESKEKDKPRELAKKSEPSRNNRADRSSSRSKTATSSKRRSPSRGSRSPRREVGRRRSTSRGRQRPSPMHRNRSPVWRRSADYRRPWESSRRRRSPSPNRRHTPSPSRRRSPSPSRRRSRSRSYNRSRRSPPRYSRNKRRSRSTSRRRPEKRGRSSSSSSSSSDSSSSSSSSEGNRRKKIVKKVSQSRSSSSSSSSSSA